MSNVTGDKTELKKIVIDEETRAAWDEIFDDGSEEEYEAEDEESTEVDPDSGTPVDYSKGYEPFRTSRQISIRKCVRCKKQFDSFVGENSIYCNKCRVALGYRTVDDAAYDVEVDERLSKLKEQIHARVQRPRREPESTKVYQSEYSESDIQNLINQIRKH